MGLPGVVAIALGLVLVVTQIRTSQSFQETSDCASDGRYMCRNGSCIPYSLKCNGAADCFGQSDELYCDKYIIEYNPFFDVRLNGSSVMWPITVDTPNTCARLCREWTPDPNDQCVAFDISVYNSDYLCKRARKGYELVPNEEDGYVHFEPDYNFPTEDNDCESDGRYTCRRGACVPHSYKCNGAHDCYGRSDELYCDEYVIEYNPFFDVRLNDSSVMRVDLVANLNSCAYLCQSWTYDPNDQCVAFDVSAHNSKFSYLCRQARKGYLLVPNKGDEYILFKPDDYQPPTDKPGLSQTDIILISVFCSLGGVAIIGLLIGGWVWQSKKKRKVSRPTTGVTEDHGASIEFD